MEAYTDFASVYDKFMDNVPYKKWGNYLHSLLEKYSVSDGLVLELGCGTGNITEILSGYGYDMIGIDNSDEMLNIALQKKNESGHDILYLNQDMREFELYGTVRAIVSICDSINYITDESDLLEVFRLVNNYLDIGGMFIFDMNTEYKYNRIGDSTIAENREECSFIWDNFYNESDKINEYDLTLFIKDDNNKYDKFEETHYQRAYALDTVKRLIVESGMEFVEAYDAFTQNPVNDKSERMYIVAREIQKSENSIK